MQLSRDAMQVQRLWKQKRLFVMQLDMSLRPCKINCMMLMQHASWPISHRPACDTQSLSDVPRMESCRDPLSSQTPTGFSVLQQTNGTTQIQNSQHPNKTMSMQHASRRDTRILKWTCTQQGAIRRSCVDYFIEYQQHH